MYCLILSWNHASSSIFVFVLDKPELKNPLIFLLEEYENESLQIEKNWLQSKVPKKSSNRVYMSSFGKWWYLIMSKMSLFFIKENRISCKKFDKIKTTKEYETSLAIFLRSSFWSWQGGLARMIRFKGCLRIPSSPTLIFVGCILRVYAIG